MKTNGRKELDAVIAERIGNECMSGDFEVDHDRADELLCGLLSDLGYTETVKAFEAVGKWYA